MSPPPFQSLLEAHGRDIHRYLTGAVGPNDAADCYQETMISALRAYGDVVDERNLRGWLFTIAHHKTLDLQRGKRRRPVPVAEPPEVSIGAEQLPDDALWGAVGDLPDKQRHAISLRFLSDLPYREIGLALDCTEAAARQNVRAGLRSLEETLHDA